MSSMGILPKLWHQDLLAAPLTTFREEASKISGNCYHKVL